MLLKITNEYGNVDVRSGVPKGYVHIPGKRLQPLCRKLRMRYAEALVGFTTSRRYGSKAVTDGVVVSSRSAPKLLAEIEARAGRNPPAKREAAARRRAEARRAEHRRLRDKGIDPHGRTAKWLRRGEIDEDEARLIAFKAGYRHEHTDYDRLLAEGLDREEARSFAEGRPIPESWEEYLTAYDFPEPEVARALANVLRSPKEGHPVWFCEAVLAVRRAAIDLASLNYEAVQEAIFDWRMDREPD